MALKRASTGPLPLHDAVRSTPPTDKVNSVSAFFAFRNKIEALGFVVEEDKIDALFSQFKAMADSKKIVYDEDLISLLNDELSHEGLEGVTFVDLIVSCGSKKRPTAR